MTPDIDAPPDRAQIKAAAPPAPAPLDRRLGTAHRIPALP